MNSLEIKHALMYYFRFKRQWLCASEALLADVMAITDKDIIEVEVKISKTDLWEGEARKNKHKFYINPSQYQQSYTPNKFYICVPAELSGEAEKWVKATNNKYGIIICKNYHAPEKRYPYDVVITKAAQRLHKKFSERLEKSIMKRVCSENINLIGKKLLSNKGK